MHSEEKWNENEQFLAAILHKTPPERTNACPAPDVWLHYLSRPKWGARARALRSHLADCRYCAQEVAQLLRMRTASVEEGRVPVRTVLPALAYGAVGFALGILLLVGSGRILSGNAHGWAHAELTSGGSEAVAQAMLIKMREKINRRTQEFNSLKLQMAQLQHNLATETQTANQAEKEKWQRRFLALSLQLKGQEQSLASLTRQRIQLVSQNRELEVKYHHLAEQPVIIAMNLDSPVAQNEADLSRLLKQLPQSYSNSRASDNVEEIEFDPPVALRQQDEQPWFYWKPVATTNAYKISLRSERTRQVSNYLFAASKAQTEAWRPPEPLRRGDHYELQISAEDAATGQKWLSPIIHFAEMTEREARKARVVNRAALLLVPALIQKGDLESAYALLRAIPTGDPAYPTAQQYLHQLQRRVRQ